VTEGGDVRLSHVTGRIGMDHRQMTMALRMIVVIVAAPVIASFACAVVYFLLDAIIWGILSILLGLSAKVAARGYFSFKSRLSRLGLPGPQMHLIVIVGLPRLQFLTLVLVTLLLRFARVRSRWNSHPKWMFHRLS
jgi:hypothetical protein